MTLIEQLRRGVDLQRSARFAEAERVYRGILSGDPRQPDALHLLGLAVHQQGRPAEALDWFRRAIAAHPRAAAFHNNLGNTLLALDRLAEAVGSFERALELDPSNAAARLNLGNAHYRARRFQAAADCFGEAARLDPASAEAHNNWGNALAAAGRAQDALACFAAAVRLRPEYAEAHVNRALVLIRLGRHDDAESSCRAALEWRPELAEAHAALGSARMGRGRIVEAEASFREALRLRPGAGAQVNLSQALAALGRWEEAEEAARRALELEPPSSPALNNLGLALAGQGRESEAERAFREAASLRPEEWEAHYNLGNLLRDRRDTEAALACYGRSVAACPEAPLPRWNRALTWLWKGDYARGLEEYDWRWRRPGFSPRRFAQPEWDGAPLEGRTILLHAEQGLGDTIHFLRYAPLVARRGGRVVVECQKPLVELAATVEGVAAVVAAGEELAPFDVQAPLLSLPRLFGTRAEALPWEGPYLKAPAAAPAQATAQAGTPALLRVGLAWAGNPEHSDDARRSCGFAALRPLLEGTGVEFHSLQKGEAPEGLVYAPRIETLTGVAEYIQALDLVIAIDSAIAHLAGALGRPVWLLLADVCDWRWGLEGERTGWYPAMRLYRQRRRGDWGPVVEEVRKALIERNA